VIAIPGEASLSAATVAAIRSASSRAATIAARPLLSDSALTGDYSAAHRLMAEIPAHITGTVWKIEVAIGDEVDEGDTVVILESMKMEMPVEAEDPGRVAEIRCEEGQSVSEGETLVVLE
jgi:acetyl-CoA carboxylase biotin carboxyl carrier protein